jgi:hypothetical protein
MSTTSSRPQRDVFIIDRFDTASAEVATRAPIAGHFIGVRPGPDRPDYCFIALRDPIAVGGRWVRMLVVCARLAGEQVTPTAKDLGVNVALVLDDMAFRDPVLDFAKVDYVGVGFLTVVPATGVS